MKPIVNFKFNNYDEFKNFILNELTDFLPKDYMRKRMMITDTINTNGIEREVIAFIRPLNVEEKVTAIEISELYKIYKNSDFNTMIKKINNMINFVQNDDISKDDILKKIKMRICKKGKCQLDINNMPHRDIFDLSLYYCIEIDKDENGSSLCPFNNEMLKDYGITEEELFRHCIKKANTTVNIKSLEESTEELIEKFPKPMKEFLSDIHKSILKMSNTDINIVIISDDTQRNGAINIVNKKVLRQVADELDSDIYIVVNDSNTLSCFSKDTYSIDELKSMNKESNILSHIKDTRLTDSIYLYKRDEDNLFISKNKI